MIHIHWVQLGPFGQKTLQCQSASCCLPHCVCPLKRHKLIIQGHLHITRSSGHSLFQWVEVIRVCACLFCYQQRWDYSLVWKRRESSDKARPLLLLSTYWLSLGWSQLVWLTECEAVCTTKVSVSVRGDHQHVSLMSLTLAWTLCQERVWVEVLTGQRLEMTGLSMLSVTTAPASVCTADTVDLQQGYRI